MPWISEDLCTGCKVCVEECPVSAIKMRDNGLVIIDEIECIRCGKCHEVCPQDAVRHDSERIPQEITLNLQWVLHLLEHYKEPCECYEFMNRIERFFNIKKKVIEKTIAVIKNSKDNPAKKIDAAIHSFSIG